MAAVTDRGRIRARNEDAFAISVGSDGRIVAAVCDGISTTAGSDRAALAAADAAVAALVELHDPEGWKDLEAAYAAARAAVEQIPWTPEEQWGGPPSCTFLAAVVADRDVRVSSLGDCRALWLPEAGNARTLTVDDSWAAEQVAAGAMTAEVAHQDPRSHAITRWVGRDAEPSWAPRRVRLTATGAGRLVLCSDGLWNYAASAADIAGACPAGDAASVAGTLVDWANAQGGRDNVTVAVLDVAMPCEHTEKKGSET